MSKWLGRGEGFAWTWDLLVLLPEEVDPNAVFPMRALEAYVVHRQLGPPDAPVCVPQQSDGDPTLDISSRPRVELPPLCCEADVYPF